MTREQDRSHRLESGPLARLSAAIEAPDLTEQVLARVEAERPFLTRRQRRAVLLGRTTIGLAVAALCLATVMTYRTMPQLFGHDEPKNLSALVEASRDGAAAGRQLMVGVLTEHPDRQFLLGLPQDRDLPSSTVMSVRVSYSPPEPELPGAWLLPAREGSGETPTPAPPEYERSFGLPGSGAP